MADSTISGYNPASALDGTEILEVVQGSGAGSNKRSAVSTIRTYLLGLANTFTAAQTNSQAVAATSTDGHVLETTTAATVGAQKWSPRIRWKGFGWKTNATAASQAVEFAAEVQPVQGAAAPTGNWVLKASIDGGAYLNVMTISSAGLLTIPDSLTMTGGALTAFNVVAQNLLTAGSGAGYAQLSSTRGYNVGSALGYNFSSTTDGNATPDARWQRKQAKVVELNDTTAGSYVGTALLLGPMTVAQLPTAAAGLAGARATVNDALGPTWGTALTGGGAVVCSALCTGAAWVAG